MNHCIDMIFNQNRLSSMIVCYQLEQWQMNESANRISPKPMIVCSIRMLNTKKGICMKCQAFIPFECNQFSRIKIIYGIWKILRSQTTSILNFELFAGYQDFIIYNDVQLCRVYSGSEWTLPLCSIIWFSFVGGMQSYE